MDKTDAIVEIWKKIIDVQQHFNDLELRIRNLALIVTGAFLGLGGYAIKDGGCANIGGCQVSSASLIVCASLLPLFAFYLMDRLWYHRLLEGAVKAGAIAEEELRKLDLVVDLGNQLSTASPIRLPLVGKKVHSRHKMDLFYGLLGLAILILSWTLAFGMRPVQPISQALDSSPSAIRKGQFLGDDAAQAICEAYVRQLSAQAERALGSTVVDPSTGLKSVFISGRWRVVPKC